MPIRILLADDHQIIRDGLEALIDSNDGYLVIAKAVDGREAVEMASTHQPDVIIMDIGMPGLNGIEAARQMLAERKDAKIIALSMLKEKKYVSQMLQAGAKGYLIKDCAFEELINAIDTVLSERVYLSPDIAGLVVDGYVENMQGDQPTAHRLLSNREREVLQLLAEGCSTKESAFRLSVSIKTIETHRRQIMKKLDLHSVAELTKYALKEGITSF